MSAASPPADKQPAQHAPLSPLAAIQNQAGQNIAMGQPVAKFIAGGAGPFIVMADSIAHVAPGDDSVYHPRRHPGRAACHGCRRGERVF